MENPSTDPAELGASAPAAVGEAHGETPPDPNRLWVIIRESQQEEPEAEIDAGAPPEWGADLRAKSDWENALALIAYLKSCHWSVLKLPGIKSALRNNADYGPRCDPAFVLISNCLFALECVCRRRAA